MVKNKSQSKGSTGLQQKSNQELDAKVQASAKQAVIPQSTKRIDWKIFTMKKWLIDRGVTNSDGTPKTVMDPIDFGRFLESHVTKKGKDEYEEGITNGNSAHCWRTAWTKHRILLGMDIKQDDPGVGLVNLQVKGKKYKAGKPDLTSPDVIDSGRLHKMVPLLIKWKEIMYAASFIMVFYGGFRTKRAISLKKKDYRKGTDIGSVIASARMKSATALKATQPGMIGNIKEVNNLTPLLDKLAEGLEPDDDLFEGWKEKKANSLLKMVAKEHGWGSGDWVVTGLRHGASREGRALVEDVPTIEEQTLKITRNMVAKRMGHTSDSSQTHYQTSKGSKKRRT